VEEFTGEQATSYQTAVAGAGKLRSKGIARGALLVQHAARGAQEQIATAERHRDEWRNRVRAATRQAAGIFGPKA
jgi:hypothetical protein